MARPYRDAECVNSTLAIASLIGVWALNFQKRDRWSLHSFLILVRTSIG